VCTTFSVNSTVLSYLRQLSVDNQTHVVTEAGLQGALNSTAKAVCPPKTVVVGGGCDCEHALNGLYPLSIIQSAPGSANSWQCYAEASVGTTKPNSVQATAICAQLQLGDIEIMSQKYACSSVV
jgi:hypothetical protein